MKLLDHVAHSRVTNTPCSFPPLQWDEICPICGFDPLGAAHARAQAREEKLEQEIANSGDC